MKLNKVSMILLGMVISLTLKAHEVQQELIPEVAAIGVDHASVHEVSESDSSKLESLPQNVDGQNAACVPLPVSEENDIKVVPKMPQKFERTDTAVKLDDKEQATVPEASAVDFGEHTDEKK